MAKRKNGNPEIIPEPPCYLIDLLPKRAPEERAAQYSALERYFRREKETKELARRLVRLLLKLHCYEELFLRVGIGWKRVRPRGSWRKGCGSAWPERVLPWNSISEGERPALFWTAATCISAFIPPTGTARSWCPSWPGRRAYFSAVWTADRIWRKSIWRSKQSG